MMNALGQPQTVVVLGGRSEIGTAIVSALASPQLRTVVLAQRSVDDDEHAIEGIGPDVNVQRVVWDATDHAVR